MSHSSARDGFTPSIRPSQLNAYVSPLNALSNQSAQSQPFSSSSILTNRLIPRDYLSSSKSKSAATNGGSQRPSPLTTQTDSSRVESASNNPGRSHTAEGDGIVDCQDIRGGRARRGTLDAEAESGVEGTRSPESVTAIASVGSSVLSVGPTTTSTSQTLHSNMPRTSSIDSAISSVSNSSMQQRSQGEARDPSPSSIRNLIATAGSAENLVLHLLKEKNHAASQNGQLWKLVEKQRALLLGLNKDLERVTKDRDRYKKKLKELQGSMTRATTQSPSREAYQQHGDNAVKPPELPQHDAYAQHSILGSKPHERSSPTDAPGRAALDNDSSDVLAARSNTQVQTPIQSTFAQTQTTSPKAAKSTPNSRKAPPKPLNLSQGSVEVPTQSLMNVADRAVLADQADEEPRGRRKTREEDDRDREKSLKQEQEARSKSKKKPAALVVSESEYLEPPPSIVATLPSSPRPQGGLVPAPFNTTGLSQPTSVHERLIPLPLKSPGLPASPRPLGPGPAAFGDLPMSPRAAPGPLSPRAPKHAIPPPMMSPSPFVDPAIIQRQNAMARQAVAQPQPQPQQPSDRLQVHEPFTSNEIPPVYQGLVSSNYPNLLLPPNALPSIQVKVASSRLRPSRHSMLGIRTQEDSTVFSLSIYARASRNELWRIEKIPAVLPQLEQQLRPRCRELPKLPDRKLFSGHSPVVIDERRQAVDAYFEELLDMEMDEPSALIICRFLSTDVLDPANEPATQAGVNSDSLPQSTSLSGKVIKTGFLTKRGKNFGGWKSRYFVLDSPELRYYETPGGPQIGTIKIMNARIGVQKPDEPPSADPDDQYRHAFLLQEPKKKDSTTYVRHVLCAESDQDRDQWVQALIHYVEGGDQNYTESPQHSLAPSFSSRNASVQQTSTGSRADDTQSNTSSPTSPASIGELSMNETMRNTNISGPMNGAPILDSTQWGNRNAHPTSLKEKSSKMGGIFHFKKASQEQLYQSNRQHETKPRILRHNGYVRAVFGLPLAEAVEFCSPFNIDVHLPAVVYRSIEYLRFRKAENEEGLFRLSGSNIVVKTLKERFNTEGDVDLVDDEEYYDVHAVASLFKTYLRELPSPPLTRDLHIDFLKVLELESQEAKIGAFNVLVHRLPKANFHLLRAVSEYLLEVTDNAGKNKMSVRNMGIVFSPTVNIPTPVFNLFLSEFEAIFEQQPQSTALPQQIRQTELRAPANLSPDDIGIRSPRHQMFSDLPTPAYNQTNFAAIEYKNTAGGRGPGHQTSTSGEFGFIPVHPSYENGQYVSMPQDAQPRMQAFAPPQSQQQQQQQADPNEEMYGSLNRIMVPDNASSDKRRKRESAMLF